MKEVLLRSIFSILLPGPSLRSGPPWRHCLGEVWRGRQVLPVLGLGPPPDPNPHSQNTYTPLLSSRRQLQVFFPKCKPNGVFPLQKFFPGLPIICRIKSKPLRRVYKGFHSVAPIHFSASDPAFRIIHPSFLPERTSWDSPGPLRVKGALSKKIFYYGNVQTYTEAERVKSWTFVYHHPASIHSQSCPLHAHPTLDYFKANLRL